MLGSGDGAYPETLTYKQAAVVQPFANTLVNMRLTGEQIEAALEQQWQPAGASRPFLRLGVSEGFTYTYDAARPAGDRITAMYLDGAPIDPAASYSVTVNSFLASGGDNFAAFAGGAHKRDTGKIDLSAMVDYLATFAADAPLVADHSQRAVGVSFPADAPASYGPGDTVAFGVSSWAMSAPADVKDTELTVSLDGEVLGTFAVDNTVGTTPFDEHGTASVSVTLPKEVATGTGTLTLTGARTGTEVLVPVELVSDRDGPGNGKAHGHEMGKARGEAEGHTKH
jgi:5'-nucleotidase